MNTQEVLEHTLQVLCVLVGREIFIMLPEKQEDVVPYLIKEIKVTLDRVKRE